MAANNQRIRIRLKAFDHRLVDQSTAEIVRTAKRTGSQVRGPIPLPTRIETMTLMAGYDLPVRAIREQISSAVDMIVHVDRLRDGSRRVVSITEIVGMEGDVVTLTDIFHFEQTGYENNNVVGQLRSTGLRPSFMTKIEAAGIHLPPSIFGVSTRRSR